MRVIMQVWIKAGLVGLTVLMGAGAHAQDQDSTAGKNEQAEAAPDQNLGISMGAVEGEEGIGQSYVAEVFTDWELRCVKTEDGKDPCQLYQLLRDQGGNAVAEFNLFALPAGGQAVVGANVITPLETLLTASLRMAVDGGQAKRYPYSFCSQIGCFARIGLTEEEVALFRRGAAANVTIVPAAAPNDTVVLKLSLSGFTAGLNALNASAQAAESE